MATASASPAEATAAPSAPATSAKRWQSARLRRRIAAIVILTLMIIVAIVMLYPFWYLIDNSFRNQSQFDQQRGHSTAGWAQLFQNLPVVHELVSSTIVCAAAILIILLVSTTAGFAQGQFGTGALYGIILFVIMIIVGIGQLRLIRTEDGEGW